MAEENKSSIFGGVDFHSVDNNKEHHTDEVSLVVRRGQNFKMTLTLMQPFNPEHQQLVLTAKTGDQHASEDRGTLSRFGYPDNISRSPSAKAVWKAELLTGFSLPSKTVALSITPPADAPVEKYELFGKLEEEEKSLGKLVVLFNPWCCDFGEVDFHTIDNNKEHHTDEVSQERLVVRRGQNFKMTLTLTQPFYPELQQLVLTAKTVSGDQHASEDRGTLSRFSFQDSISRSPSAKAVWKAELLTGFSLSSNAVTLSITPPADAPVGEYELFGKLEEEEKSLGKLVVLFNPWCSEDSVHLSDGPKRQEYVLNEHGIIFKGSANYIFPEDWDYGQFEENMVDICLMILDCNHKHDEDPAEDVASRSDPVYVSRVISAMINSQDDSGVLVGRWESPYSDGKRPTHWTGSYPILNKWLKNDCIPVKYGQCWVFAGVMCSVMRLLGIPCRVVTNFNSAHDVDMNLIIDTYVDDDGDTLRRTMDSIWNFHVWTEGWMKRPDLGNDGEYDGWQTVDPTPQELSDGVYCCGPASVKGILNGHTEFNFDTPFIYAEVNADRIVWRITESGEEVQIDSDKEIVGKNISTKAVGSKRRMDITNTYKHKEGSEKERNTFSFATTRDYSKPDYEIDEEDEEEEEEEEEVMDTEAESGETDGGAGSGETDGGAGSGETDGGAGSGGMEVETTPQPPPPMTIRFKEVSRLINGKDVNLNLVLKSKSSDARPLSIHISVQAMNYNGTPTGKILTEDKEETLLPGKALSVPILVPFLTYHKPMVESETMRISVIITDKKNEEHKYLDTYDVVLLNPQLSITAPAQASLNTLSSGEVTFTNPVKETLTNCTLTLSGGGLFKEEVEKKIEDLKRNDTMSIKFDFTPYKKGEKTLTADFDCDTFRDVKASCTVNVIE